MNLNKKKIKRIISSFKKKHILVVGDLILDHHIFGKVERISPEAPVPVVWANRESFACGGAANVGLNLRSLAARVSLCGTVGKDYFGYTLLSQIAKSTIDSKLIIKDSKRPTTLKTRIMAHHQQVVRVDWESVEPLSLAANRSVINKIEKNIDNFDAVIIEDYGKGVVNSTLVESLVALCKKKKKIITVDPKEENFDYYEDVTAITPNLKEAQGAVNMRLKTKQEIPILGKMIMEKLRPKALLLTLGEDGMMLFFDKRCYYIPTAAVEVFDVTGAGDTVIAAFTLALSAQAEYKEAALIANLAAGIVVEKLGAATTNKQELFKRINEI